MATLQASNHAPAMATAHRVSFDDIDSEGEGVEPGVDRIAVHLGGTCKLERPATGGIWRAHRPVHGDMAFMPAGTDSRFRSTGSAHVLKVRLPAAWRDNDAVRWVLAPSHGVRDHLLRELLLALAGLPGDGKDANEAYAAALSEAIHQHLAAHHLGPAPPDTPTLSSIQRRRALEFIEAKIGGQFSLADFARELGLSPGYASTQFTASFGRGPHAHFAALRLESARRLLLTTTRTAGQISREVGFSSPSYFGLVFRASFGRSPDAYRKRSGT